MATHGQADAFQRSDIAAAVDGCSPRPLHLGHELVILAIVVGAAVWAVYRPACSARADYFDDGMYLGENRLVQNPGWESIGTFFREVLKPSTVSGYYQPLAMVSLALDTALGGGPDNYLPYRRTSLALHVMNTVLLVLLLYGLFGNAWVAAAVGLLFGVHPVTVEPVPWTGERKTLLAAFFALWCLVCYVYYVRRRSRTLYGVSLLTLVLALLSKPTTTPLPLLLLLLDFWPLRRLSVRALLEKIPFFAIAAVSAVITVISQARAAAVVMPGAHPPGHIPFTLAHNIMFYLWKLLWPTRLSSLYPYPEPFNLSHPMVLTGVVGSLGLIAILLISLRWTRAPATGWLFFFVALLPTMNVIGFTNVIASHKYVYLPMVGLLLTVAWALGGLWDVLARRWRRQAAYVGVLVPAVALGAVETLITREQLGYWRDTEGLYRYMLQHAPTNYGLQTGLAYALFQSAQDPNRPAEFRQQRVAEAIEHYRLALQDAPQYFVAHNNLGNALAEQGRLEEALEHFRQVVRLRPEKSIGYSQVARALHRLDRVDEAVESYEKALEVDPHAFDAVNGLAVILAEQGKFDQAAARFRDAIRIHPKYVNAYIGLGMCLLEQRKIGEAISILEKAQKLAPKDARVGVVLSRARARLGGGRAP